MTTLVNAARRSLLYIDGQDYSSKMISWQVSDSSANKNGIIQTQGELILGEIIGGNNLEDYDRNLFKRGVTVQLYVYKPDTLTASLHPRGTMYVISTGYSPESSNLSVKIGCRLTLAALTENVSEILPLVPLELEEDRQDFSNCAASFAAAGKVLYQDGSGNLVVRPFFEGDSYSTAAAGSWTSIIGETTISVTPMLGGDALPDAIIVSYQYPDGGVGSSNVTYESTDETSYYPLQYPGFAFERINGTTGIGDSSQSTSSGTTTSSCGNEPGVPAEALGLPSCTEGYYTAQYQPMVDVEAESINETWYDGPAGQVSRELSTKYGPGIEVNSQYYADRYAYCKYLNANACNPAGSCPFYGADDNEDDFIKQSYSETTYEYGSANELVKTTKDDYENQLSLAIDSDWRSGISNGIPEDYREIDSNQYVHIKRVITEYLPGDGNTNTTEETTYDAPTDTGISLGASTISCLGSYGIKSTKKTITTTITGYPIAPDSTQTTAVSTIEGSIEIGVFTSTYTGPTISGPYKLKESIPIPLLIEDTVTLNAAVYTYTDYLVRWCKGDAYGVTVTELLRNPVINSWIPGMPFYLCDVEKGKILALRMDATVWGVNKEEAIFVTNGIWIGDSLGTLTVTSNITGNTTPTIPEATVPPIPPVIPQEPSVTNGSNVNNGPLSFPVIELEFGTQIDMTFPGLTGIVSVFVPFYSEVNFNTVLSVNGFSLMPGNLLTLEMDGKLPVAASGNLVTGTPTLIDSDLFSP